MFSIQLAPLGGIMSPLKSDLRAFWPFIYIKEFAQKGQKYPYPNLTSEGLKYPPEVRVEHKTCSTICETPVQAILDEIFLTRLGGGSRKVKIWPRMHPIQ